LAIQPTQLVASLTTRETDVQHSSTITLNMTEWHDPDVVPTNRSGVRLELFFHPASAADVYQGLGVSQLSVAVVVVVVVVVVQVVVSS